MSIPSPPIHPLDLDTDIPDEQVSLLSEHHDPHQQQELQQARDPQTNVQKHRAYLLICLLIILIQIGQCLHKSPLLQIYESVICRALWRGMGAAGGAPWDGSGHDGGGFGDGFCRSEPVQSELASVRAWQMGFEQIPALFLALPYGLLADRRGRRLVLFLSVLGVFLGLLWTQVVCWFEDRFSPRMVWGSALFYVIGGGQSVVVSIMYTIILDVSSDEQRASSFFFFNGITLATDVIVLPLSSLMMDINPWIPIIAGDIFLALCLVIVLGVPETRSIEFPASTSWRDETGNSSYAVDGLGKASPIENWSPDQIKKHLYKFVNTLRFLWGSKEVLLILGIMLVNALGSGSAQLLVLYATKKFEWKISKANLLLVATALTNLLLLLILLPAGSHLLRTRLALSPFRTDLVLSRFSVALLCLGTTILFLAQSMPLFFPALIFASLGAGFPVLLSSLISRLITPEHAATLYTSVGICETVGYLISAPALSWLYHRGLVLGGLWTGLPFLAAGIAYACAMLGIWVVVGRESVEEEVIS